MADIDFRFYFITDRNQCKPHTLTSVIKQACEAGIKAVQLREKNLPIKELFVLAKDIGAVCKSTHTKLLLNDRFDVATAAEANGVHLTSQSLPVEIVRKFMPAPKLIGVSTHSIEAAKRAEGAGADFILFGPVFHTESKAKQGEPQGLAKLQEVAKAVTTPVFAVGGIDPVKARQCREHGAWGVAAISAVMKSKNIGKLIKKFEDSLGNL